MKQLINGYWTSGDGKSKKKWTQDEISAELLRWKALAELDGQGGPTEAPNPLNSAIEHMSDGAIRAYTSVGSYPIFYLTRQNQVLHPQTVEDQLVECCDDTDEMWVVSAHVNWENPHLYCDISSEKIEAAYGDDSEDDSESEDEP